MRPVEYITEENFRPYGKLIKFPADDETNFYIVANDSEKPWRLAVYRYWNDRIRRIECHPDSMESFEPVSGTTILLVAEHEVSAGPSRHPGKGDMASDTDAYRRIHCKDHGKCGRLFGVL